MGAAIAFYISIFVSIFLSILVTFALLLPIIMPGQRRRAAQEKARERRMAEHRMNARLLRFNL